MGDPQAGQSDELSINEGSNLESWFAEQLTSNS